MRLSFYLAATMSALTAQNYNSVVRAVKIDTMPPDTQSDSLGLAQTGELAAEQIEPSLNLTQTKAKAKSKSSAHQKAAQNKDFVSPGEANKAVQDVADQNH